MDIHRLEVFCKVVELRSFTKAADAVFLTQPTVSEHIRALEESLGERLIDRLGREAMPTPAGKILYRYAREILQIRNAAMQALQKFRGDLAGQLLMGASTIPGTYLLPELIGRFKALYPAIGITLRISSSGGVVEGVLDGSLEAGLIGARWDDRRIVLEEVFSDELVLVVTPDHPLAKRPGEEVPLAAIEGMPFILRERGSGTRMVMARALEAHGFSPSRLSVVAEMGSTEAVRQSIKARIGVSILSARAVAEDIERGTLAAVPLQGLRFFRPFYLAQRKNRQASPLCAAFLEHLRANAPQGGKSLSVDESHSARKPLSTA